jgi:RNA polymerase sigma-70 factor (ECF subfamily)
MEIDGRAAPPRPEAVTRAPTAGRDADFAELFRLFEPRIGRFLAQFVRDRQLAEDLLQDTFHDAMRSAAQLDGIDSPEAWLFGIARNRALAALRRKRRLGNALARLGARRIARPEAEEVVALRDLLERTLSVEDRALVILRYLHDFEAGELAAITSLSPDAVRQRLSRARKRLAIAADDNDFRTGEPNDF